MSTLSSLSSRDPYHAHTVSISEASFAYLKTADGMRDLALGLFIKVGKWITILHPSSKGIRDLSDGADEAKSLSGLADLPEKFVSVLQEGYNSYNQKTAENLSQVVHKACDFLSSITSLAEPICQRVYPITAAAASAIACVSNTTGVVARSFDVKKNIHDYEKASQTPSESKDEDDIRKGQLVMQRIGAISDIAAGVLGVLSYTLSLTFSPWILLAVDTNALACSLAAQFYPQIHTYSKIN